MTLHIQNIGTLYTMEPRADDALGRIEHASLTCANGHVQFAGAAGDAPTPGADDVVIDAEGKAVLPGLIDCHTHLLWTGTRRDEFAMRARGASYAEIMAAGGGIRRTMQDVRGCTEDDLARSALPRLEAMLWRGVTTTEAKSGYGLSLDDELKMLRALRRLHEVHEIDIVPTFLGAHAVPPEFDGRIDDYVSLVVEEMLPAVAEEKLAQFCDVFIEQGAFSVAQGQRVLEKAKSLGLGLRVHAEQLSPSGGARLAADLEADAASHLEFVRPDDMRRLADANVVCEILAISQVFLGMEQRTPGRALADAGCSLAVATDLNPGSAHSADLHLAAGLAVTMCGLTVEEALLGMTRNAAKSLRRDDLGILAQGACADAVILDSDSAFDLVYEWGHNAVRQVIKRGKLVDLGGFD